jgi:hypothetical protein
MHGQAKGSQVKGRRTKSLTTPLFSTPWRLLTAIALFFIAPHLALAAEPALDEWHFDRQEWTWDLAPGAAVSLHNPWGDIRVRSQGKAEAYLLINAQRHKEDPREVELKVVQEEGRLVLTLHYPEGEVEEEPEGWKKRRIDATLMIPAATNTKLKTDRGLLEARGLSGFAEAESYRGEIRMRAKGGVRALNEHGRIYIQFLDTRWKQASDLETVTGNIRVEMPRGGRAEVKVETRGEITTDYSMTISREDGKQLKQGKTSVGEGGKPLSMKSNRGAIALIASLISEN